MPGRVQLFHDRRQGPQETVDDFAQDLWRLYSQAYAGFTRGTPEAEKVGQTVLASQFVAGLHPSLQAKIVGMDGDMDQLVLKVCFEEAKSKELSSSKPAAQAKVASRVTSSVSGGDPPISTSRSSDCLHSCKSHRGEALLQFRH